MPKFEDFFFFRNSLYFFFRLRASSNSHKSPIVRRFLEWLIEKASLYLDSEAVEAVTTEAEEIEHSEDNGIRAPPPLPQRFVFKAV